MVYHKYSLFIGLREIMNAFTVVVVVAAGQQLTPAGSQLGIEWKLKFMITGRLKPVTTKPSGKTARSSFTSRLCDTT